LDNAVDFSLLVAKDSGFTLDSHFLLLRDFGLYAVKPEWPQEIGRLLEVWTHVEHLVHDIFYTDHACRLANRLFYHSVVVQCNPALVNGTIAALVNQLLRIQ